MKSIKALLLILTSLLIPFGAAYCANPEAPPGARDTGIDERLGGVLQDDIALYDESGRRLLLGSLIEKPTIVLLAYYSCPNICATVMADLAEVLGRLKSVPGADYSVITVSFDEKDTPGDALRKKRNYIKAIGKPFPDGAWRFLTGDRENISRLASSLGYRFRREEKGFTHPSSLVIVSPERKIIRYIYGSGYLAAELDMAFLEAKAGAPGPTIPKALLFCYTYDPLKDRYVFDFLKASGLGVLSFAAGFLIYLTKKKKDNL